MLFQVLEFEQDQIIFADPSKPFTLRTQPDVIIPVGNEGLEKLLIDDSILKVAGSILDFQGVPVVPVFGSGYVEKNSHLFRRWAEDFYKAYQTMLGVTLLEKTNQVVIIEDATHLMDLIDYIQKSGYVAFDFETSSLTDKRHYDPGFYLTAVSFTFQQGSSYVLPLWHKESQSNDDFIELCREQLEKEVFLNPDITKIGQNVKFDMHCLDWWGIPLVRGPIHDTMVMHHILDEHSPHGLKQMTATYIPRYAGYDDGLFTPIRDEEGNQIKISKYEDVPLDRLIKYTALDTDMTFRLYWIFTQMLLKDERLYLLLRNLVAASTPALFAMEQRGMLIDREYLEESIKKVDVMLHEMDQEMREVKQVKEYNEYRMQRFMKELADDVKEKIEKRKEKMQDRHDKRITNAKKKLDNERNREYKTEKAQQNQKDKIADLEQTVKDLERSVPDDAQIKEWEAFIADFEGGEAYPPHYLNEDQTYVNFGSPDQVVEMLYGPVGFCFDVPDDQYGRPLRNSGKNTLELLKDKTGFIDNLLAWRQLGKVRKTYLQAILDRLDEDNFLHGVFNQHGTKTGRLSSSDPNLQNIIKRTKYAKVEEAVAMVMKCFIAPKGMEIVQADYSQAELRLIAFYADDQEMLGAYAAGEDLHAVTAATTMSLTLDQFKALDPKKLKQYRYEAKSTNFGFIYGMSPEGFKEYARTNYGVTVSLKQAKERRTAFFKKYSNLPKYHQIYIAKAKKFGYVRTLFGRRIRIPDIYSSDKQKVGHAERNAINGPIQGTAGEMMIFALALLYHRAPALLVVNTVHDSNLFYTLKKRRPRDIAIVKETMENLPIQEYFGRTVDTVDMKADFEASGSSWGELKEL